MTTTQRWRERRALFRPKAADFKASRYEVVSLAQDSAVKPFIEQHHYAGSYPAAQYRFGLYEHGVLVGAAVFGHSYAKALTTVFDAPVQRLQELQRLVLLDEVPYNAESWFVARTFQALRQRGITGVLSFSDPVPRLNARGDQVLPGHVGCVYQALNATYLNRGTARTLHLLPDGTVLNARTLQKLRAGERGWVAAARKLEQLGAPPCPGEDAAARRHWVRTTLPTITRPLRHPGNHRYAWSFGAPVRMTMTTPYPKRLALSDRTPASEP